MAEMNVRGILRKSDPPKKRNLSTRIPETKSERKTIHVISHNYSDDNKTTTIPLNRVYPYSVHQQNLEQRYTAPELNTAKKFEKQLEELKNWKLEPLTDVCQLTPRTKSVITEKVITFWIMNFWLIALGFTRFM